MLKTISLSLCCTAAMGAANAQEGITVTPIVNATETLTGQPIVFPQHNAQVTVSTYEIAPKIALPVHKHPFPRYAFVQQGTLRVDNVDTGTSHTFKKGEVIIEAVDQWHKGVNVGKNTVKLLVIDLVEKGQSNTILRP